MSTREPCLLLILPCLKALPFPAALLGVVQGRDADGEAKPESSGLATLLRLR